MEKVFAFTLFLGCFLCVSSCGPSKKELKEEIDCKNDTIRMLRNTIIGNENYIEDLEEKLENVASYAVDVQTALDDGSFSDAYDAACNAEEEADYENY